MFEGGKDKKIKMIRLWLLFINFAVILACGVIYFFSNWDIVYYYGAKASLALATINILSHFILNRFLKNKPTLIFEISIFQTAAFSLAIIDYFGGAFGSLSSFLYIITLGAFIYKKWWGYTSLITIITYLGTYLFFAENIVAENYTKYISSIVALVVVGGFGYLINYRNRNIEDKSEGLKKVADKLTAEKSQDEAVLTAIADGVYAVDRERRIVLINKAAQEMISWTEKDALGINCKTVMKLKDEKGVSVCEKDCPALAIWNTDNPVFRNDTCFNHKKSNKKIQLSSSYAPIKDMGGNTVGAICVFRDITKEKELERQKNEFVSTASHELRTPITATEGYLSIITDSGMCKTDDNTKEYLKKARNTLMGMSNLVKNLLSVTKIEEGKLETNITNFSIKELIDEVFEVFLNRAKAKGINFVFQHTNDETQKGKKVVGRSLNVRADREMVREVLNNLVENAIKFTEKGGVTISIDYDDEFATVNISDTGIGVSGDAQKHLFEKFYRVDNTATREVGGTGLGLYITRSIIENFGGSIWVESIKGKGSKFHFTVPLALD